MPFLSFFKSSVQQELLHLQVVLAAGVLLFQESIGQVFLPRLSDLFAADDRDGMRRLYHLTSRWAIWPALIAAAVLVLWDREILAIFDSDFATGAAPLAVLAAAKASGDAWG